MGAQNFNFAPKFPQTGGGCFNHQILHFGGQFSDRNKFFRQFSGTSKFRGGGLIAPPVSMPRRHPVSHASRI